MYHLRLRNPISHWTFRRNNLLIGLEDPSENRCRMPADFVFEKAPPFFVARRQGRSTSCILYVRITSKTTVMPIELQVPD